MAIAPSRGIGIYLEGEFAFTARPRDGISITDHYELGMGIPLGFPRELPAVTELGGRVPRDGKHHVNPDGTLCLGSPVRLLRLASYQGDLCGFAERCLVPFLYAISHKLRYGGTLPFSELAHGDQGILDDYLDLFGLADHQQVVKALRCLGMKRRVANKSLCPCECGLRLGKCSFHHRLNSYRNIASRSWFRGHAAAIGR